MVSALHFQRDLSGVLMSRRYFIYEHYFTYTDSHILQKYTFFTPMKVFGYLEVEIDNELVLNDVSFY